MERLSQWIVKHKTLILIVGFLLLIPSVLGMMGTRINYDMLTYLPEDMDTVKGQDILLDDFGKGAFSMVILEGMEPRDVAAVKAEIEKVDHVDTVIWYDSLMDISVPMEFLPEKYYEIFNQGDATLMAVFFDTSTSADATMEAIEGVRKVAGKQCFISGMSAMVTDLKNLCEREEPIYVGLAVLFSCAVMMLFMDSWLIPLLFLFSIGMAILYNLGSNYFLGEISYITKALSAVLQLGVTMDYSIFLWHSYSEEKRNYKTKETAMAHAIANTITSVVGSSITTVAGFIALCFMSFTLGKDLGIVMAKGVIFGVIGCVTILPSLILLFDKAIEKTKHRSLIPNTEKMAHWIVKYFWVFLIAFAVLLAPALYGYANGEKYYQISESLPKDMDFAVADTKLQEQFGMASTHMILAKSGLPSKDAKDMLREIENVDGVGFALGMDSVLGSRIPEEFLPETVTGTLKNGGYQLILVTSDYKTASDEVNAQIEKINAIIKKYDESAMLIGEAPCTKDLIEVTDYDFQVVNIISIAAIFIIIALVLKSVSLPVILVAVIELAIFINLGIPYYTGNEMAFITPICISTIQLGATVDYAILMTTRYKRERYGGADKKTAISTALAAAIPSIVVSAFGFFAATFGVAVYSNLDIISSMCNMMARGAMISMLSVIFILPSMFMVFDKLICKTGSGFRKKEELI